MPAPTLKERLAVNRELKKMGFGGIDDPNLLDQFAFFIRTHEQFRGILMAAAPDQRKIAYESLAGRLKFTPKPLDVYEHEAKDRAEREQWDVWNGTAYPDHFKVQNIRTLEGVAEKAIAKGLLTMHCAHCTLEAEFPGENRNDAVYEAYKAGWRWAEGKHYCPAHVPEKLKSLLDQIQ